MTPIYHAICQHARQTPNRIAVNTPFLTQHHRRIIKPPACTQQVSYH